MGKAAKAVTKAVSSVVPKITMDPGKAVSKAVQGVVNLQKDVFINPAVDLASTAVGGVGKVMSQPGAGAILGAAGTAFGVPGAGLIAGAMTNQGGGMMSPSPAPIHSNTAPIVISAPAPAPNGGGMNSSMMMIMGAAFIGILLIAILFLGSRGKR